MGNTICFKGKSLLGKEKFPCKSVIDIDFISYLRPLRAYVHGKGPTH